MPGTFSSLVVASTNDFPGTQNESIKRWVEANGGVFLKEIHDNVTHLICSKKAWKQYHPTGKLFSLLSFVWYQRPMIAWPVQPDSVLACAHNQPDNSAESHSLW